VIRLDGVEKTYRTRRGDVVRAVEDVTLHVEPNEIVTLVGPSGCGKSTLLKLVAGLTPATLGAIHIREQPVREPFPDVGFVFQQPVLLPWRSMLDNVLFSVEMLGLKPHLAARLRLSQAGTTSLLLMLAAEGKVRVTAVELASRSA
jgi:NitT/TauT family transport system ATP-binding protein